MLSMHLEHWWLGNNHINSDVWIILLKIVHIYLRFLLIYELMIQQIFTLEAVNFILYWLRIKIMCLHFVKSSAWISYTLNFYAYYLFTAFVYILFIICKPEVVNISYQLVFFASKFVGRGICVITVPPYATYFLVIFYNSVQVC